MGQDKYWLLSVDLLIYVNVYILLSFSVRNEGAYVLRWFLAKKLIW